MSISRPRSPRAQSTIAAWIRSLSEDSLTSRITSLALPATGKSFSIRRRTLAVTSPMTLTLPRSSLVGARHHLGRSDCSKSVLLTQPTTRFVPVHPEVLNWLAADAVFAVIAAAIVWMHRSLNPMDSGWARFRLGSVVAFLAIVGVVFGVATLTDLISALF